MIPQIHAPRCHAPITDRAADKIATLSRAGVVTVPVCKTCGHVICNHSDLHFAGLAADETEG